MHVIVNRYDTAKLTVHRSERNVVRIFLATQLSWMYVPFSTVALHLVARSSKQFAAMGQSFGALGVGCANSAKAGMESSESVFWISARAGMTNWEIAGNATVRSSRILWSAQLQSSESKWRFSLLSQFDESSTDQQ